MKKCLISEVIRLKIENRSLRKTLKKLKDKEKPYIDLINKLKSDNRILKLKLNEVNKSE